MSLKHRLARLEQRRPATGAADAGPPGGWDWLIFAPTPEMLARMSEAERAEWAAALWHTAKPPAVDLIEQRLAAEAEKTAEYLVPAGGQNRTGAEPAPPPRG